MEHKYKYESKRTNFIQKNKNIDMGLSSKYRWQNSKITAVLVSFLFTHFFKTQLCLLILFYLLVFDRNHNNICDYNQYHFYSRQSWQYWAIQISNSEYKQYQWWYQPKWITKIICLQNIRNIFMWIWHTGHQISYSSNTIGRNQ